MSDFQTFQNQQTLTLEDEEYQTVTEGRIRIRIGVVAFVFMLLIAVVRLAEISRGSYRPQWGAASNNLRDLFIIRRAAPSLESRRDCGGVSQAPSASKSRETAAKTRNGP